RVSLDQGEPKGNRRRSDFATAVFPSLAHVTVWGWPRPVPPGKRVRIQHRRALPMTERERLIRVLKDAPRGHWSWLVPLVMAGLLASCGGLGPRTIPIDQVDYADAISDAGKRQVLLNVVKLHFGDFPAFVAVSQLVAGYQLSGNMTLAATLSN